MATDQERRSIVLIHGAWHGGWCWDDVAGALREQGHEVLTPDLPGHDNPGNLARHWHRISHYLEAIDETVRKCEQPPVLVGHSMGGYLVQRYLENNTAPVGILVASAPHTGVWAINLKFVRTTPAPTLKAMFTLNYRHMVGTEALVREMFFCDETPVEIITRTSGLLQNESPLAINEMMVRSIRTEAISSPIRVIGGAKDVIFAPVEQRKLASAHGTVPQFIDCGHDIMLEPEWPQLADAIAEIVRET